MKNIRFLPFILTIVTVLLSACGGAAATPIATVGGRTTEPIPVAFIGMVDSIAGDQWVINGQNVTVSSDVIRDRVFNVGDQVKVEGVVSADGSFTVSRLETPTPQDATTLPQFGNGSSIFSPGTENSANENSSNENEGNENQGNENNGNENNGNENVSNENEGNENNGNENNANENSSNENGSNENESNENEGNENSGNENESNENEGNENGSNENESNENEGNENGGGENEENENESNSND